MFRVPRAPVFENIYTRIQSVELILKGPNSSFELYEEVELYCTIYLKKQKY